MKLTKEENKTLTALENMAPETLSLDQKWLFRILKDKAALLEFPKVIPRNNPNPPSLPLETLSLAVI